MIPTANQKGAAGLRARLSHLMEIRALSMRSLSDKAGLGESAVKMILSGKSKNPRIDTVAKLAAALGVSTEFLLIGPSAPQAAETSAGGTIRITVIGAVEAGTWREAFEWEPEDQYAVTAAPDRRYPNMDHFALEVRGPSMDEIYPEGTILVCIRYADLGREPLSGERVICQRTNREGLVEATVKELVIDEDGRPWLWPRSKHPKYQQPIALPHARAALTERAAPFHIPDFVHAGGGCGATNAGAKGHDAEDLTLLARVVASYRPE